MLVVPDLTVSSLLGLVNGMWKVAHVKASADF